MRELFFSYFDFLNHFSKSQKIIFFVLISLTFIFFVVSMSFGSFNFFLPDLFSSENSLNKISEYVFNIFALPISAILGSAIVITLLYFFTRGFGYQGITYMLLIGIAINALASVGIGVLTFISSESELRGLTFWTMGSFGGASWQVILPAIVLITLTLVWMIPSSRKLDLLQLGEPEAYRLGIDVQNLKFKIIISSAIIVGISVSLSGMIGFVGLVVPHLVRLIGGVNHSYLLPTSALFGASLMMTADLLSRILISPAEIPVGLITSALGAPFFLWLIYRSRAI